MNLQAGDIMACYGTDRPSWVIRLGTFSLWGPPRLWLGPSHVAVICEHPSEGLLWVESTSLCRHPCIFRGEPVDGVQAHRPQNRIADYMASGGCVEIYRPTRLNRLTAAESQRLTDVLMGLLADGVAYDLRDAIVSGTRFWKRLRLRCFPGDVEQVFCSELIAGLYMELGHMRRDNPARFNPACLLRQLLAHAVVEHAGLAIVPSTPASAANVRLRAAA